MNSIDCIWLWYTHTHTQKKINKLIISIYEFEQCLLTCSVQLLVLRSLFSAVCNRRIDTVEINLLINDLNQFVYLSRIIMNSIKSMASTLSVFLFFCFAVTGQTIDLLVIAGISFVSCGHSNDLLLLLFVRNPTQNLWPNIMNENYYVCSCLFANK